MIGNAKENHKLIILVIELEKKKAVIPVSLVIDKSIDLTYFYLSSIIL